MIKHIDTYGRNLNDFTIGYSATTYKITDNGLNDSSDSLFVGDVNKIITDIEKFAEIGVNFISFQLVGDNLDETKERINRVLTNDPGIGVARHVDANYNKAIKISSNINLDIPMSND